MFPAWVNASVPGTDNEDFDTDGMDPVEELKRWQGALRTLTDVDTLREEFFGQFERGEICGEEGGGIHIWSEDGIDWNLYEQIKAYSKDILWDDGSRSFQNHFERPFLLIENGQSTHLFAATGTGPKAWQFDRTWNMVIPLRLPG